MQVPMQVQVQFFKKTFISHRIDDQLIRRLCNFFLFSTRNHNSISVEVLVEMI